MDHNKAEALFLVEFNSDQRRKFCLPIEEGHNGVSYQEVLKLLCKENMFKDGVHILQEFHDDFETYINIEDTEKEFCSKTRLKIVSGNTAELDLPVINIDKAHSLLQSISASNQEQPCHQQSSSSTVTNNAGNLLPKFSAHLQNVLNGTKKLTDTSRRQLQQHLIENLIEKMCIQFITKYPAMRDNSASGYGLWKAGVRDCFKYGRKKERKVGSTTPVKRGRPSLSSMLATPPTLLSDLSEDLVATEMSDIARMAEEMKKSKPDWELLNNLMENTFEIRKDFAACHTAKEVIEKYPALLDENQIYNEFQRITGKNMHQIFTQLQNKNKILCTVANATQKGKKVLADVKEFENLNEDQSEFHNISNLLLISAILREDFKMMYVNNSSDIQAPSSPVLFYSQHMLLPGTITVSLEGEAIIKTNSFTDAFKVAFALYWVYSIQFPRNLTKTFQFVEALLLKDAEQGVDKTIPNHVLWLLEKVTEI